MNCLQQDLPYSPRGIGLPCLLSACPLQRFQQCPGSQQLDYQGKGRALLQATTSPSSQESLLERHRDLASPTWHQGYFYNIFPLLLSRKLDLSPPMTGANPEEQKSNPGAPSCRDCTLLETSTADGCSCSSQLGRQPPAPTHQPCSSGVLRKERISEDFNAGLGCPKFSLFLLPPAQPVEAGGLRCGLQPGTASWSGHVLSLIHSLSASSSSILRWLMPGGVP